MDHSGSGGDGGDGGGFDDVYDGDHGDGYGDVM
jgi:hypothetical protein